MADKGSSDAEIDYQYPDEDIESEADFDYQEDAGVEKNPQGILSRIPKKKLIIGAGIAAILFAVFQVLTPQDEEAARNPQAQLEPAPTPAPEQKIVAAQVPEPTVQPVVRQQQPAISLAPVQVNTADADDVAQLQNQLQSVGNEVVQLKETLSALIGALEVMAMQVQDLREAQQLRPSTFMPFKPKVAYFLKAVVPGRAWLESTNGDLITVKEGDVVPEYGTINEIDHNEGWVETNSGLIISYGRNDS